MMWWQWVVQALKFEDKIQINNQLPILQSIHGFKIILKG